MIPAQLIFQPTTLPKITDFIFYSPTACPAELREKFAQQLVRGTPTGCYYLYT